MPDPVFDEPRLATIYDQLDPDRSDLDAYAAVVDEFGVSSVLDLGCGTGTFGCMLAERGIDVVGVDPDGASLDVARAKPGADRVRWIEGDASTLPPLSVDAAFMTANVAQVFLTDDDWAAALRGIRASLRPGGRLVFESRDPAMRAWEGWTEEATYSSTDRPVVGRVEAWCDVTEVAEPMVTFRWSHVFASDGAVVVSDSTLRFRSRAELEDSLDSAGFDVDEVRDAPDRPGRELVFVATRRD